MNLRVRCCGAVVACFFLVSPVLVRDAAAAEPLAGPAFGLTAGTLGAGVELSMPVSSYLVVRADVSGFKYDFNKAESDIDYGLSARWLSGGLIADLHPFQNGFRVSVGGNYSDRRLTGTAKGMANYEIGNGTYTAAEVGTLRADLAMNKIAPYVGIGYDASHLSKGFHLAFEVGALYVGRPRVSLSASNPAAPASLASDLAIEEGNINDTIKRYGFYPVATVMVKYTF